MCRGKFHHALYLFQRLFCLTIISYDFAFIWLKMGNYQMRCLRNQVNGIECVFEKDG